MTTSHTILLVDDEADIRDSLSLMIESFGYQVDTAADVSTALQKLNTEKFDMCLTDMNLPNGSGLDIIQYISKSDSSNSNKKNNQDIPIAVFTAHGNIELAVECLKQGAFDFISKPVLSKDLKKLLAQGVKLTNADHQHHEDENRLLGDSQVMETIRTTITKIARSQAPVHISGPSGCGKELAAKQIHANSARKDAPFVTINCGAIPKDLVESEFFGYKKGSFSGATQDKQGLFHAANQGSLFLDEIADLPLDMQVKLLRAIQEKKIRPIGSNYEEEIDVRIISATHKDLKQEVENKQFRKDLFFRINVIPLNMPALSEHPEDIEMLCHSIFKKLNNHMSLSDSALSALQKYDFPGNVRELENIIERASAMADSQTITAADLALDLPSDLPSDLPHTLNKTTQFNIGQDNITDYLEKTEQDAIHSALEKTQGNKTKAAALLGISFRSLRHKLTKIDS